jgi:hypothetical protein
MKEKIIRKMIFVAVALLAGAAVIKWGAPQSSSDGGAK